VSQVNLNLNVLLRQKKDVQRHLDDLRAAGSSASDSDAPLLGEKMAALDRGIEAKMGDITRTAASAAHVREEVCETSQASISRLMIELDTGGNVRLEDGKPTDVWYSSCVDLVLSRFVAAEFVTHGIDGLRVTRVTRIHNRMLRNRFDEHLEAMVNTSDPSYKRSLEYLFHGEHPELREELGRVIEDGFGPAADYRAGYGHAAVPLCNSLGLCDMPRIRAQEAAAAPVARAARAGGPAAFAAAAELPRLVQAKLHTRLLITKAFLARCTEVKGPANRPICEEDYEGFSSVYRPMEAEGKQREWYVFEPALVLPEYLVEIEYTATGAQPEHEPTAQQLVELGGGIGARLHSEAEAVDLASLTRPLLRFAQQCALPTSAGSYDDACTAALNMPLPIKQWTKATEIDTALLLACARGLPLEELPRLNLHGNSIRSIEGLGSLRNLRELILCFNEVSRLDGLEALPHLETLDLGFNLIKRVEGLAELPKLHTLELNNNLLYRLEDVAALRKSLPQIRELNLHNNLVCELKGYRRYVVQQLGGLTRLDGVPVAATERDVVVADASRSITRELLKTHGHARRRTHQSRLDTEPDRSQAVQSLLDVSALPGANGAATHNQGVGSGEETEPWCESIEELHLDHFNLRRLHDLETLVHLRRASFCDNDLTRIEGLEHCVQLEELSLEDNKITKLENLAPLVRLTKLDLGKNRISRIDGLQTLTALTQLSLEDNDLTSLAGLATIVSLLELYIGNNRIADLKEVQQLKNLPKLIILDISGNELCTASEYRTFTIYHLRKLKVLDGIGIEARQALARRPLLLSRLCVHGLPTMCVLSPRKDAT
jgi:Leucine-rich repeat (LRR) protein